MARECGADPGPGSWVGKHWCAGRYYRKCRNSNIVCSVDNSIVVTLTLLTSLSVLCSWKMNAPVLGDTHCSVQGSRVNDVCNFISND